MRTRVLTHGLGLFLCCSVLGASHVQASVPLRQFDTLWMTVWDHEFTTPDFQCRHTYTPPVPCEDGNPGVDEILAPDQKPSSSSSQGTPRVHDWFTKGVEYCRMLVFKRDTADPRILVYPPSDTETLFFPIDDAPSVSSFATAADGKKHNFAFCDETHGVFKYRGGEKFQFSGDDDLFLYVNGKIAVDMGGCHSPMTRVLELDKRAKAAGQCTDEYGTPRGRSMPALDLDTGKYYSFDLYHCERQTNVSNFMIRMSMDVKPPLPPDYYIGLDEHTVFRSSDTVTIDKTVGPTTVYSFLSREDSRQSNCRTVTVGAVDRIQATWKIDGTTVGVDSLLSLDPARYNTGTYVLTMQKDTAVRQVVLKVIGAVKVANVVATPPDTTFGWSLGVSLSTTTAGASIFYTIDGSEPTEQSTSYTGPITLMESATIRARAFKSGGIPSDISTFVYTRKVPVVSDVNASPPDTAFSPSVSVVLTTQTAGASIYYTVDGTEPTEKSTPYTGQISLSQTTVVRARAFKSEMMPSGITQFSYTRLARVVSAYYKDLDADGRIETAVVQFDMELTELPEAISFEDPFSGTRQQAVSNSIERVTGQQGIGTVANAVVITLKPMTFGTNFSSASLGSFPEATAFVAGGFTVHDSVAPVARTAEYHPGAIADLSSNSRLPDTLVVVFSEPVSMVARADTIRPFQLVQGSAQYTLGLAGQSGESGSLRFVVYSIEGVVFPRSGDSLWVKQGEVRGSDGKVQMSPDSRRVPLKVIPPEVALTQRALTPFTPGPNGTAIPPKLLEAVAQDTRLPDSTRQRMLRAATGTALVVKPLAPNPDPTYSIHGRVSLYDALGNIVIDGSEMALDNQGRLLWIWDGRNHNGRFVGSGTYLAVVAREERAGGSLVRTTVGHTKIGVRR